LDGLSLYQGTKIFKVTHYLNEAFGLVAGSKLEELGLVFNPFERSLQPMRARLT
jgi:hypothetical protein